jgi:hypothetical protein
VACCGRAEGGGKSLLSLVIFCALVAGGGWCSWDY